MLLLPEAGEAELVRRGRPSVLEQIEVLRMAAEASADAVVAEMMSIRPELLRIESLRIFQPHILILTNARIDHTEHWGPSRETAARCLAAAMTPGCTVFVAEDDMLPVWEEAATQAGARLHPVDIGFQQEHVSGEDIENHADFVEPDDQDESAEPGRREIGEEHEEHERRSKHDISLEFRANVRLAQAVTDHLKIERATARRAFRQALPDLGSLRIWRWQPEAAAPAWDCVNAFAANDPASTRMVMHLLSKLGLFDHGPILGLLNLRRDRGDRTLQWLEAFQSGYFPEVQDLFVVGDQARAFERLMTRRAKEIHARVLRGRKAEEIMAGLASVKSGSAVVVGMGNMAGAGRKLVEYWEKVGESRAV